MDRWLIDDTFACRVGLGREAAVKRAMQFCCKQPWCLKLDVRKYFDSINHDRLLDLLTQRFKEAPLLALLDRIVRSFRGSQQMGLPIGSLMSQHFANFYLGWFDRYVKESLQGMKLGQALCAEKASIPRSDAFAEYCHSETKQQCLS